MINKEKYIEHIKDKEQYLTMHKVLDKVEKTLRNHQVEYTDFLDPYQRKLCYSFLNRFEEISYVEEGGFNYAERKSIIIFPYYFHVEEIDNPVKALEILGGSKFKKLNHRDYLGSILSLGIRREKVGDIAIHKSCAQLLIHKDLVDFIKYNLKKINTEPVIVNEIEFNELIKGQEEYKDVTTTIASLRLDVVISAACNISRANGLKYIERRGVKVNWEPIVNPSKLLHEGDIISVKGFGRIQLLNYLGSSKKGRDKVIIRIFK